MVGISIGLAISNLIPIVTGFSIFTTGRAWEFIRLVCHDNLNVKIITTHAGFVGEDGSTHNALEDISLMATLPNMKLLVPSDNKELKEIFNYILNHEGPCYIRLPRGSFPNVHNDDYRFSLGSPDVILNGEKLGLIGTGYGTVLNFKAAIQIRERLNISPKVINIPTIKPINKTELINSLSNVDSLVITEEHNIYNGFGSIVARIISETNPLPIKFIGVSDSFGTSGEREKVLDKYGLNIEHIYNKALELIDKMK